MLKQQIERDDQSQPYLSQNNAHNSLLGVLKVTQFANTDITYYTTIKLITTN